MVTRLMIALVMLGLAGCATKQYSRAQPVSSYEAQQYTCRDIRLELAKVDAFDEQIRQQAKFSAMSVASFLGDFGIGNVAARHSAENSSAQRRAELNGLAASKGCDTTKANVLVPDAKDASSVSSPTSSAEMVLAAQRVASGSGCGDVSESSSNRFVAQCSGYRMLIECDESNCRPIRSLR